MKKLFSILSALLVLGMVFTSCDKSEDEPFDDSNYNFKSASFQFMDPFSEDLANLLDLTCTYTSMDGTTKNVKLDEKFAFNFVETSTKLPVSFKVEVKAVKSANYETYKASKESFKVVVPTYPLCLVYSENQAGQKSILDDVKVSAHESTIDAEKIDEYIDLVLKYLDYTYGGTFEKDGKGAKFTKN